MSKKVLLIDGNSIMFRAFFAMHNQIDKFTNSDGLHTAAIYGFKLMLDHVLNKFQPDYALAAFDAGRVTFRTKMDSNYKGGRNKTPDELVEQIPYVHKLCKLCGLTPYQLKNYEADDIIGTLAKQADERGYQTMIVTGDRDLIQLSTANSTVVRTMKGVTDTKHCTPQVIEEEFGIKPEQIIDQKALMGDNSDNYPGVTGIGEKRALKLVQKFGTVEKLYENIDQLKTSKMKEHLIEDEPVAREDKKLATILRDAPITIGLDDISYQGEQRDELIEFYQQMNFNSFLAKMGVAADNDQVAAATKAIHYQELTKDNLNLVHDLPNSVSFILEIPDANYHLSPMVGFLIGSGDTWLVSRDVKLLQEPVIADLLNSQQVKKNCFNAKEQIVGLHRLGITLQNVDFDLLLASYLLDTNDNNNDLGALVHQHDYFDVQTDEEVYGKGAKRAIPEDDKIFFTHLARKGRAIEDLHAQLRQQLADHEQLALYHDIELPLTYVLAQMEINGFKVDSQLLKEMGSKMTERLTELEQEIYNDAGEEFNINSPKQLGKILFEKMGLPVIKKTKSGYSTAVAVLEKLRGQSPIIDHILTYRQINKVKSTYVAGLLKVIHSTDGKVHTRYLQTLTQTGRLSSVDPNLQNIPVRTEEGRQIRHAFVPSHEGWKIFSSDYSQIELRVLAHVTGDQNLQQDFKDGKDIHASTARRIFHLAPGEDVTPNMRRHAKAVNFGIVYGISAYGLSQSIHVSRKQAQEFIDNYFHEFPGVKKYIDTVVKSAHENGYVETLTHRRRYLPDIHAKNFARRSFAERTAMNTPIQGSAADIIKIAMIHMAEELKKRDLKARMLLQIHDELVFEAPADEIATLQKLVPHVMDSAVKLDVPLKVDSKWGDTWYDLKK